ncbi:suppression of tumorigenicity 18 protein isoform X3 [Tachysurus ichikawai]
MSLSCQAFYFKVHLPCVSFTRASSGAPRTFPHLTFSSLSPEDAFHAKALRSGETRSRREQRRPRRPSDSHSSSPYKDAEMDSEGDENRVERRDGNASE